MSVYHPVFERSEERVGRSISIQSKHHNYVNFHMHKHSIHKLYNYLHNFDFTVSRITNLSYKR